MLAKFLSLIVWSCDQLFWTICFAGLRHPISIFEFSLQCPSYICYEPTGGSPGSSIKKFKLWQWVETHVPFYWFSPWLAFQVTGLPVYWFSALMVFSFIGFLLYLFPPCVPPLLVFPCTGFSLLLVIPYTCFLPLIGFPLTGFPLPGFHL